MELVEGLMSRRTISTFSDKPVDREIIEKAIYSAVHAPNHKNTEPWHFYILSGNAKERLAKKRGAIKAAKFENGDERAKVAEEKGYQFMMELPWVVVVTTKRSPDDPVRDWEDYAAVSCAIQNFMLSIWSEGVGTKWSTGPLAEDQEVLKIIGADEKEEVAGILFVGYPEGNLPSPKKRHVDESVTWLNEG